MEEDVLACREAPPEVLCEYEVQLQVQNGNVMMTITQSCGSTNSRLRWQALTSISAIHFSFSLAAVPFDYCGVEGVNYWSDSYG